MKKFLYAFVCAGVLLSFGGCTGESRPDYAELSRRLSEYNENYAFEYFDMFLYEGAYQVYFSLCSRDDVLLSMNFGEDGSIDNITVTACSDSMKTTGERAAYCSFALSAVSAFTMLSTEDIAKIQRNLSFDDTNIYFSDLYETYTLSRYNFIFSSNSEYICLYAEYFEEMELSGSIEN
ncbi:MAG: hypothetical protein LUH40_02080 [Clostridiales bacterium]|nr:hypothetical protein [Clostridiales bacterium]